MGRGLYLPRGKSLEAARTAVDALRGAMLEGCLLFDVAQRPPLLSVSALREACGALDTGDIAFIGWSPRGKGASDCAAVVQLCRDMTPEGQLSGAVIHDPDGLPEGGTVRIELPWAGRRFGVTFGIARRGGRLSVRAIHREVDGGAFERLYG